MGDHKFCMVDWYRSCRNSIFYISAYSQAKVEDFHQQGCRSNDCYCSNVLLPLFPALHMGRVWLAFYIFPYPNTRGPLWVNFNSPLFWDFIAITAYLLISVSFWYLGMLPDFATIRDKTTSKIKKAVYGFFSIGWTGSSRQWIRYESLSFILGGIAAVLVVSVHSIVSTDFAVGIEPGWHTTLFPPYFVVGAIFSGFAMVMTLMVIIRKIYKLTDYITDNHMDAIARILVFISLIMGTAYSTEIFVAWYSGNEYEMFTFFRNRITGDYTIQFWGMIICNALIPQLFWFRKMRRSWVGLLVVSLFINLGMWFERFNIVVTSLSKDFLPSNWVSYTPTYIDIGVYVGTIGIICSRSIAFHPVYSDDGNQRSKECGYILGIKKRINRVSYEQSF